jgi:hypothetical protein
MSGTIWVGIVAALLLFALWSRFAPSLPALVRRAAKSGDLAPLLAALEGKRATAQPTAFNQAIRLLWEMDRRELAVELVRELAARHGNARIAQYWLREALTVEPGIARGIFTPDFLSQYYQPEVAAQCGPVG